MALHRLEFKDDKSSKFWEVSVEGSRTITTWGRIGTDGQTRTKEFASAEKAAADAAKKVADKIKKGYVDPGVTALATPPAAIAAPANSSRANPEPVTDPTPEAAPVIVEPEPGVVEMPKAWQRRVLARRGYPSASLALSPKPDPARGFRELTTGLEEHRAFIEEHVAASTIDPAILTKLTDEPATFDPNDPAEPHAAAIRAQTSLRSLDYSTKPKRFPYILDHWVASGGLSFAVQATEAMNVWASPGVGYKIPPGFRTLADTVQYTAGNSVHHRYVGIHYPQLVSRLRHYLAQASDAEYHAARAETRVLAIEDEVAACRISFLFPTERDWVEQTISYIASNSGSNGGSHSLALSLIESPDQLDRLLAGYNWPPSFDSRYQQIDPLPTLLEALGAETTPYLRAWLHHEISPGRPHDREVAAGGYKAIVGALAIIGDEAALDVLTGATENKYALAALNDVVLDRPHAAIRVLAKRASVGTDAHAKTAAGLLRTVVREHPDVAATVTPSLSEAEQAVVNELGDRSDEKPVAPPALTPTLLVDPPWDNRVAQPDAMIVEGLELAPRPATTTLRVNPTPEPVPAYWQRQGKVPNWEELAVVVGTPGHPDNAYDHGARNLFAHGAADLVLAALSTWEPAEQRRNSWTPEQLAQTLSRRFGTTALPSILLLAKQFPAALLDMLITFDANVVALPIAHAFSTKRGRTRAAAWFDAHHETAASGLVPASVGPLGDDRTAATAALRYVAQADPDSVRGASQTYGAEAEAAVDQILAFDELQLLPKRMPKLPDFISLPALTLPLLADGSHQLTADAAENLMLMLAISKPAEPYAGLVAVAEALERDSLASFAWQLLDGWKNAGYPSKHGWILNAQGIIGNDETVRQLVPLVRAWPGESGHARAVNGLDALAAIGSDLALMELFAMSRKLKFKGLKNKAGEKVQQIADQRGLTAEQLGDRLVPDLDLDADGSLILDYGPRSFTVGFDETLKPFVRDETGKLRKTLPKPAKKDDPELAPAAYRRFSALKKDARAVASDQLSRLEQAMIQQRRWTRDEFEGYFLTHPLVIHLARRVVWGVYESATTPGSGLAQSFRIAEDNTLASAGDDPVELPAEPSIGIVHPLDMTPGESASWGELLSDYEVLQPFEQIGRATFEMTTEERAQTHFTRFVGPVLHYGKYLGLEHRGWERGEPQDGGAVIEMVRRLPDGTEICIELEEGLWTGMIQETPDQSMHGVRLRRAGSPMNSVSFDSLSPIVISELLRDLTALVATDGA